MRRGPISVLIDLPAEHEYHRATVDAIRHAAAKTGVDAEIRVVPTDAIEVAALLASSSAIVVGPGSPYTDQEAVHEVIRGARERGVPLVGT